MLQSVLLYIIVVVNVVLGFSDVGTWDLPLNGQSCNFTLAKSLFKDSKLIIALHCNVKEPTNITIAYTWMQTNCSPDYFHYFEKRIVECTNYVESPFEENNITKILPTVLCHGQNVIYLTNSKSTNDKKDVEIVQPRAPFHVVQREGIYALWMSVRSDKKYDASMHIEMVSPSGYMSAAIWPLLPFFGVMCAVYTALCAGWLWVCALQWRDLLRIQYWIGGVALLGMLESATYYGVYSAIDGSGYFNAEAYMFAEWMSVAKRALARMLVIIVSLGFGIVK
ncbi:transmembrane protein 87B-like [Melitaea cinxia]|uniref:transmembrane protein 87B-like n=1 Tax=Melitaea cinxia TaxID=113334 RepID=UPI001E2726F3|nr:transmembrane protein 87B-like [Melitaea cinxia]